MAYIKVEDEALKIDTWNTGGGCLVDVIYLKDGTILCISDDYIGLYENVEAFNEGEGQLDGIERPL